MKTRLETLVRIRNEAREHGLAPALRLARSSYEKGLIDSIDVPEVFIALKSGSWGFLDGPTATATTTSPQLVGPVG